jgi:hypothetical protein
MSTEIDVEMRYARGGGPSGTMNVLGGWRTETGCRADEKNGTACRLIFVMTAVGPRSERTSAASGSVVPRHAQSDLEMGFFPRVWCIGHIAPSSCEQVHSAWADVRDRSRHSTIGEAVRLTT